MISIIIPNYDDPRIENTIASIICQSYSNYELIIVEGRIQNKLTSSIYAKYKDYIHTLIHEEDKGIFDALNKGILTAKGDYVFLIGSDDVLSDLNCFKEVHEATKKYPEADGICLGCRFINNEKKIIRKWIINDIKSNKMKWGILPPHFSLFLRKDIYNQMGLFNFEKTYIAADTEWLLRLATKKEVFIPVIKNHYVDMGYGGASTGSISYILKSIIIISKAAKNYGVPQWPLTPIIKIISKIFQLRMNENIILSIFFMQQLYPYLIL